MTAFVLDLSENGYGILRALSSRRIPVVGFYRDRRSYGRLSRLCDSTAWLDMRQEGWFAQLTAHANSVGDKPVLFPTSDEQIEMLMTNQRELEGVFRYHWWPDTLRHGLVDKLWMHHAATEAGLTCPLTHVTRKNENIELAANRFVFPCIVKPGRSSEPTFPPGVKNFVAHSAEELLAFYEDTPDALGATIWQEIIEGADDQIFQCNALVRQTGAMSAFVCVRKIRQYLPGFGVMCFGRSEHNAEVVEESSKLLRYLDYRGLASIEFKWSTERQKYYFIEMNPRLPWYNSLFPDAGVNLAWLAYLDLTEGVAEEVRQRGTRYWAAFREDLAHQVRTKSGFGDWLSSIMKVRSWAWWNPGDPKPFLWATGDLVRQGVRAFYGICRRLIAG